MAKPNLFTSVQLQKPKRNVFDLTHDHKLSLDMGELVPIMCLDVVPGDSFSISCESILRFAPLVAPVMHRFNCFMHYFFVPYRLVWDGWEDWIAQNDTELVHPTVNLPGPAYFPKLCDYLGMNPPAEIGQQRVSALHLSAYQLIYNEYYRDQNLITEVPFALVSGDNTSNLSQLSTLRKRAWMHDYFTSALPWAQKGGSVEMPLTGFNDVKVKLAATPPGATTFDGTPQDGQVEYGLPKPTAGFELSDLYAETSALQPTSATINDLRRAFKLQEWLERNARGGTRYTEVIRAHFGVRSSDARMQRPEYITGTKSPVVISEVLNTTGEDGGLPQGNMAGHGIGVTSGKYGKFFAEEFGCIIGIMSVMPVTAYQQGQPKMYIKTTDPYQYYWPEFAHIGEQEILNREIFAAHPSPEDTFGYTPRYAEYKYMPSRVSGEFKTSLNYWHEGRIFATPPALNQTFIECVPSKRIFAVQGVENSLYAHVLNKVKAVRPMPKFGTPSF